MHDAFGGACWYQGNSRSHVEVNVDDYIQQQDHVYVLLDTLCHEVYPGHHTAYTLREQHLYFEQGCLEEAIGLIFSPAAVMGEGIATSACGMLFSPRELEEWLAKHVYLELGIEPDGANVTGIQRATDLLESIWGNAMLMMREGNRMKLYESTSRDTCSSHTLRSGKCLSTNSSASLNPLANV
jgi:hypothetical protein